MLITKGEAPTSAVPPKPIPRDGLFKLDVDDDIWQDVGLDDDQSVEIPGWLGDDKVREGIRAMLELDRCNEEKVRVMQERTALQEWFVEEWNAVASALLTHGKQFSQISTLTTANSSAHF